MENTLAPEQKNQIVTPTIDLYPRKPQRQRYSPKVKFEMQARNFTIKTASSLREYKQAFKLRFDVFYQEMGGHQGSAEGFDYDVYDELGDLILIIDRRTNAVVGTYRIIASQFSDRFYSQTEFDLSLFLDTPDIKTEVSRACVHPDYRNGVTLSLLWQGVLKYAQQVGSRYLFGCSSVWTACPIEAAEIVSWFKERELCSDIYKINPLAKYNLNVTPPAQAKPEAEKLIAPLLKSYLKAGAKVHGDPAFDKEFDCFDFFTVLDMNNFSEQYRRRYS